MDVLRSPFATLDASHEEYTRPELALSPRLNVLGGLAVHHVLCVDIPPCCWCILSFSFPAYMGTLCCPRSELGVDVATFPHRSFHFVCSSFLDMSNGDTVWAKHGWWMVPWYDEVPSTTS